MIGDLLYALTNRDGGSQFLEAFMRQPVVTPAASVSIVTTFTVPLDRCLVLTSASAIAISGAAQTCTSINMYIEDVTAISISFARAFNTADAQANRELNWAGYLLVKGGNKIGLGLGFNAGANPNDGRFYLHGYLLPLGNVGAG